MDDEAITGGVIAALGASPRVRATEVRVVTKQGWVELTGIVGTLDERDAAEEISRSVPGVVSVSNDLTVSSDGTVSDLEIERMANDRLVDAGLAGIGARVEAGTAFLMGVVPNVAVKERAFKATAAVRGVRDVISELEIAAGEPVDDLTLADDVAEALSDDPRLETMGLTVRADNGDVLLLGEVTGGRQSEIASDVAETVPGVKSVTNRMKVHRLPS